MHFDNNYLDVLVLANYILQNTRKTIIEYIERVRMKCGLKYTAGFLSGVFGCDANTNAVLRLLKKASFSGISKNSRKGYVVLANLFPSTAEKSGTVRRVTFLLLVKRAKV